MKYFPIFFDLDKAATIIVGGGEQSAQKIRLLLKTGARIIVIAGELNDELTILAESNEIEWRQKDIAKQKLTKSDLERARLVYITDADKASAQTKQASKLANILNIPVNVVDRPELSSFITPSLIDRSPVTIAIGTEGSAPVLARHLKAKIETLLPDGLGELATRAKQLRQHVAETITSFPRRRKFWENFFNGAPAQHFLAKDETAFKQAVENALDDNNHDRDHELGRVSLVGAGPGDPDLLTLKAQRLLQQADVIIYDRLIGPQILDYARRDATRIAVGKTPGENSIKQIDINRLLVREALDGKHVVRLKGGDPFIFGRGGEELEALRNLGIAVDIVPGITAAAGCAASIGLALTHRGQNRNLTLITGMSGKGEAEHDWQKLAVPGSACAIYMGMRAAPHIQRKLLEAGIERTTPVVIVQDGTLASERVTITDIVGLNAAIKRYDLKSPAIIFIGLAPDEALKARATIAEEIEGADIVPLHDSKKTGRRA